MGLDKYKGFVAGEILPAENVNSIDPDSLATDGSDDYALVRLNGDSKIPNLLLNICYVKKIAGETITGATLPVPIAIFNQYTISINQSYVGISGSSDAITESAYNYGQTFTLDANINYITTIDLKLSKHGSPTGDIVVSLYETSAGVPTGSAIATVTKPTSEIADSATVYTFTFNQAVSPSTMYAVAVSCAGTSAGNYILVYKDTSNHYAGGTNIYKTAGSWGTHATEENYFSVSGYYKYVYDNDQVIMSDANSTDTNRLKFHGFAITTGDQTDEVVVQTGGIIDGFSSLTKGAKYYVQDAIGTIGTSAGSTSILVGYAIDGSKIQIEKDITKL